MQRKLIILLLLSGSATATFPQQPSAESTQQSEAVQSLLPPSELETTVMPTSEQRDGLIHLDVAAADEDGKSFGDDLSAKDFTLLQDGTATKIVSLRRSNPADDEERLSEVDLVLDEIDLSPVQFALVKNATMNFLRSNGGVLAQPVSILWLRDDGVYASASPTTDGNGLAQDIATNHLSSTMWKLDLAAHLGSTIRDALWDDVLRTVYALALKWKDKPGRKSLVWIGYGWSILGKLEARDGPFSVLVELSTRMREARMVIYNITPWPDPEIPVHDKIPVIDYHRSLAGLRSPSDVKAASSVPFLEAPAVPYLALPVLAMQSGGLVLDDSQNLENDISRCVRHASKFYTISFDPPHAAQLDEFHDVRVLIGTKQSQAAAIYGYYNQPVFYDQPSVPEKRLSVSELQQLVESDSRERDRELARKLNSLELTERLSTAQLATWRERLHGKEAKAALTALADQSVFLVPPTPEIANLPATDDDAQRQITLRAENYLDTTVPMLPDFSADVTTVKYEQPSPVYKDAWKTAPPNRALTETVSEQATFLYRNGREQRIVEKQVGKRTVRQNDLNYKGIFGPILGFVLEDVRRGNSKLIWARWEQTDRGKLAVFRYSVRAENPRYGVVYCCLVGGQEFQARPEHHGELSIDPDSGEILRITVESEPGWISETDLSPLQPVLFSNMMVEYGPVEIGGRRFICPHRSVVITRTRTVRPISFWGFSFSVYGPDQTLMNDTTYTNYHKFGSESRILPGFDVMRDQKIPPSEKNPTQPQ